jgi:hypothetical protein
MRDGEYCHKCKYAFPSQESEHLYICKRFPPEIFATRDRKVFSKDRVVSAEDWCGEFMAQTRATEQSCAQCHYACIGCCYDGYVLCLRYPPRHFTERNGETIHSARRILDKEWCGEFRQTNEGWQL